MGLKQSVFLPKKGDVLLWHGNLIHAGSPRKDLSLSRRAIVLHYFARGAVCYHDLSGTLTPMERLKN
jgi:ectoine hydroxylase-related dioxygenase (phytanoyl-CoA dioxygenase family)